MLVTTPVHLRVLLAEPETPPPVDLVLCATAPLATHLAREAEARFAGALYEIYGCSEAGQVAARRTAVTEEWRCLDGISLRQDAAGTWASGVPIATETVLPDVIELRDPTHFLLHGRHRRHGECRRQAHVAGASELPPERDRRRDGRRFRIG